MGKEKDVKIKEDGLLFEKYNNENYEIHLDIVNKNEIINNLNIENGSLNDKLKNNDEENRVLATRISILENKNKEKDKTTKEYELLFQNYNKKMNEIYEIHLDNVNKNKIINNLNVENNDLNEKL